MDRLQFCNGKSMIVQSLPSAICTKLAIWTRKVNFHSRFTYLNLNLKNNSSSFEFVLILFVYIFNGFSFESFNGIFSLIWKRTEK